VSGEVHGRVLALPERAGRRWVENRRAERPGTPVVRVTSSTRTDMPPLIGLSVGCSTQARNVTDTGWQFRLTCPPGKRATRQAPLSWRVSAP
jgi:hypothetical protein